MNISENKKIVSPPPTINYDMDTTETIIQYIDIFVTTNPQLYKFDKFEDIIFDNVYELLNITLNDAYVLDIEDMIANIYENIHYYFNTIGIPRSHKTSKIIKNPDIPKVDSILKKLRSKDNNQQKTDLWYINRWNLLTASSIWQAIDTQSSKNRLIYQKCKPLNIKKHNRVNINSPLHHGQKYESLSVQFYEHHYQTKIEEFGCITHKSYDFLGASPDGINNDRTNPRYGRMLEIKNIVNREINGIPKKVYWIQMQMQMEVCNLNECDFLETRFKEYKTEKEFLEDGGFDCQKIRGIIICFHNGDGPVYKYSPFLSGKQVSEKWLSEYLESNDGMTWVKNIYWSLEDWSCVLVPRNKAWFNKNIDNFKNIWNTISKERITGYDHRKPKTKQKRTQNKIVFKIQTESLNTIIETPEHNN